MIDPKIQNLKDLNSRQGDLLNELDRSLALQKLVPGCFDHGSASVKWISGPAKPGTKGKRTLKGYVTLGNGERKELPPEAAEALGVTIEKLEAMAKK